MNFHGTSLKTTQISNSVKIRPVGADGRTDRLDEASSRYFSQILNKHEFPRYIFENYSNIKFRKNPPCGSRRTDRQTDLTKLIVAFHNFASAPKNWSRFCPDIACTASPMASFILSTVCVDLENFYARSVTNETFIGFVRVRPLLNTGQVSSGLPLEYSRNYGHTRTVSICLSPEV